MNSPGRSPRPFRRCSRKRPSKSETANSPEDERSPVGGHMGITPLRRREFVALLGGVAAWPLPTRAQQAVAPVIGFLDGQSSDQHLMMAFRQALKDAGYVEGR